MSDTAAAHGGGGWVHRALPSSILGLSLFESQWQRSEQRKKPLPAAAIGPLPHLSDDHWDNSKRKSKNAPQGMEREGVSSCVRAVRALQQTPLSLLRLLASPAPCSHDPKGPAPLTGHRPGARARLSSFIMSQDGTLWLVPTVFCKMLIFQ